MTNAALLHAHHTARLHEDNDEEANAHLDDLLEEARRPHPGSPKTPLRHPAPEQTLPPVVLVEGFFSFFNEVGLLASITPR